jgi:hypothetical protein
MKKQLVATLSVVDAIDNLTSMADLDLMMVQEFKRSIEEGTPVYFFSKWLNLSNDEETVENIRATFRAILEYLKESAKFNKDQIKEDSHQKGLRAVMVLVDEAAHKIDRWTDLFSHKLVERSVKEFKEYQELKEFYHKKLLKKIRSKEEEKDLWLDSLEQQVALTISLEEKGLKDLQTVKEDKQYELFLIKNDDGKPFFNRNLLRHIKLVHDFDLILLSDFHEDPFIQIQKVREKTAWESAKEIRKSIDEDLKVFFKTYPHLKNSEFFSKLSAAFYGLSLATSAHNLSEKKAKKGADQYFADFCCQLSESFVASDYRALVGFEKNQLNQLMKDLLLFGYRLCFAFFHHIESKGPMMGFLNDLMGRLGQGETVKFIEPSQMWTSFLEGHAHLQKVLNKYPNGPLFKLLDHFQLAEDSSYEPLIQQHIPQSLYRIECHGWSLDVLKVPSPTRQERIDKAEGSLIFLSYLHGLNFSEKKSKVFFVNLQDRTSWQEASRCHYLESLNSKAEFNKVIQVATLAKQTIFYHQEEEYLTLHHAADFKKLLQEQISSAQECGFYFVEDIAPIHLNKFCDSCIELIHRHIFGGKETLSRKNRRDFIEIFYNFLILKLIDIKKPNYLLLSCKDGVDTSATTSAGLFGFIKILSQDDIWSPEEADFFLWMMHSSALMERERAVFPERFERTVHALMTLQAELILNKAVIVKDFQKLFQDPIFSAISVTESKF